MKYQSAPIAQSRAHTLGARFHQERTLSLPDRPKDCIVRKARTIVALYRARDADGSRPSTHATLTLKEKRTRTK